MIMSFLIFSGQVLLIIPDSLVKVLHKIFPLCFLVGVLSCQTPNEPIEIHEPMETANEVRYPYPFEGKWSEAQDGLRVGFVVEENEVILSVQNTHADDLSVYTYVNAGEWHYDFFTLHLVSESGEKRAIVLMDTRNKSGSVPDTLKPGESIQHRINISDWAKRDFNGNIPIEPGTYDLKVVYEVDENAEGAWTGKLTTPSAKFIVKEN